MQDAQKRGEWGLLRTAESALRRGVALLRRGRVELPRPVHVHRPAQPLRAARRKVALRFRQRRVRLRRGLEQGSSLALVLGAVALGLAAEEAAAERALRLRVAVLRRPPEPLHPLAALRLVPQCELS